MEIKPSHYQPEIDRYLLLNDGTWYQLLNGHWFVIKHLGKYEVIEL